MVEYLKLAQDYVMNRGDENYFAHYYSLYRTQYSVRESVWKTMEYLYGVDVANDLESRADYGWRKEWVNG